MFMVSAANKRQKQAHKAARNARMHHMHIKQGSSIRMIAKHYDLHPSTVHTIIRRESKQM